MKNEFHEPVAKVDPAVRKKRNQQCQEICRLPAREVASALTFAWGYLQAIEENSDRSFEVREMAGFALNAIGARLLSPGTLRMIEEGGK